MLSINVLRASFYILLSATVDYFITKNCRVCVVRILGHKRINQSRQMQEFYESPSDTPISIALQSSKISVGAQMKATGTGCDVYACPEKLARTKRSLRKLRCGPTRACWRTRARFDHAADGKDADSFGALIILTPRRGCRAVRFNVEN